MIPLLTYRFNLMATRLRAKAELQKIAAFTAIEKEDFISKKIVAFHFNKQPFLSTAGFGTKSINNWTDLPFYVIVGMELI
jgi:hypothetical protein